MDMIEGKETIFLNANLKHLNTFRVFENLEKWERDNLFKEGIFRIYFTKLRLVEEKIVLSKEVVNMFHRIYKFYNHFGDVIIYTETHKIISEIPKIERNINFNQDNDCIIGISPIGYNFKTKKEVILKPTDTKNPRITRPVIDVSTIVSKMERDNQVVLRLAPDYAEKWEIEDAFSVFGTILNIKILRTGTTFITFASKKSVKKACDTRIILKDMYVRAEIPKPRR